MAFQLKDAGVAVVSLWPNMRTELTESALRNQKMSTSTHLPLVQILNKIKKVE